MGYTGRSRSKSVDGSENSVASIAVNSVHMTTAAWKKHRLNTTFKLIKAQEAALHPRTVCSSVFPLLFEEFILTSNFYSFALLEGFELAVWFGRAFLN